jgi:spore maturation protein CgeB
MKILFIQTNYPNFLDDFYKKIAYEQMNYWEIKNLWSKEFFGSCNFYLKNLKKLGWEGVEIIANDSRSQSVWAKEHALKTTLYNPPLLNFIPARLKNLIHLNDNYKKIVFSQIDYYKPDVVYIHDVTFFSVQEINIIKKKCKLVVGQIAYPKPLNDAVLKSYNLIISSLPNFVKDFKKSGINTEYLQWCFEDEILKTIKPGKKMYDVTYIGGFSPHHSNGNKVLEEVSKKVKIDFWGYGVNFLPINSNIKKNYHGEAWGKKMYKIFGQSKIVINRHINLSENYANNMRMFESTGMGSMLTTDNKINMGDFFIDGTEVVTYDNPKDLINKIKYFLKHDKERNNIAKRGQKRTLRDHTYKVRMKELDVILRKYL